MPSDLSTIDLATLNAAQGVIVTALRNQCCQWEQDSADAIADGHLSNAVMLEHWAFAAVALRHCEHGVHCPLWQGNERSPEQEQHPIRQ